ncbi:hypothetical protein ACRQV7_11700 [Caproiciproducens sp. R2]|uniref:hypothetical protein n=1 Tax=Caproiciproducens sp. R2 TaxID=3435187 RepID=UPI0040349F07
MDEKKVPEKNGLNGETRAEAVNQAGRSKKPENQNQSHNTKKASLGPNTKRS